MHIQSINKVMMFWIYSYDSDYCYNIHSINHLAEEVVGILEANITALFDATLYRLGEFILHYFYNSKKNM